jgi:hypothetical protein
MLCQHCSSVVQVLYGVVLALGNDSSTLTGTFLKEPESARWMIMFSQNTDQCDCNQKIAASQIILKILQDTDTI